MQGPVLEFLATVARQTATTPEGSARSALQLLGIVVVALALVLVLVAMLVVLAVLRRGRPGGAAGDERPSQAADAWSEAGRRAEPATRHFGPREPDDAAGGGPTQDSGLPVRNAQSFPSGQRPVAVITGGSRRVGRAIAQALAEAGCDLVITSRNAGGQAASAADDLCQLGVAVHVAALDLSDPDAVLRAGQAMARELPRVDVLVHNASVYEATPLEGLSATEAERAWRINALSPLMLTRALASRLASSRLAGGGSVVAMLDVHALGLPRAGYSAYSMSKAALAEMVRSLARELAPRVRVNGVAPGVVAWPEGGPESSQSVQREYLSRVPLARAGTPDDAAVAVRWLALEATYVTGQIVRVDGGRSMS